jgi:multidrug resistance efflux pump
MNPIVKFIATGVIVLAALSMTIYKYLDYMKYPWTRDGLMRAQVVQIVPRVSGALVQVPIQNNQLVKKGDLLFEIDPRTFQATVNLARAQFDNMRDIVKSLAEQVDALRSSVDLHEAELTQAKFEVEGFASQVEDARIILGRAKDLLTSGFETRADVDNKNAAYQVALARLNTARAKVIQTTAAVVEAKDALARGIADLGTSGRTTLGCAEPRRTWKLLN